MLSAVMGVLTSGLIITDSIKNSKEMRRQKKRQRIDDQYNLNELYRTRDTNTESQSTGDKTLDLIHETNRKVNNNVKNI